MGQDWKTLVLVVVAAAIAGWSMVRALSGGSRPPVESPVAVASAPAPLRTVAEKVAAVEQTPRPAAPIRTADVPAAPVGDESELIERDLALLSQSLVRDQRIEDRVMPRVNDVLNVPGVTTYRRAPDFWEGALGGTSGTKP